MGKPYNLDQDTFRGYADDGNEGAGTPKADANLDWTQDVDENFRVRYLVEETNGGEVLALAIKLQYNLASGGWNDVTGSSSIVKCSASGYLTEGGDCTQVLGGGTHFLDNNGQEDNDGTFTTGALWDANEDIECEFCLQIVSGDVADEQTLQLRLVEGTGTVFTAYTNTPTITVNEEYPEISVSDTVTPSDTVAGIATTSLAFSVSDSPAVSDVPSAETDSMVVSVSDPASVTDLAGAYAPLWVDVSDSPGATDSPSVGMDTIGAATADSVTVTDTPTVEQETGVFEVDVSDGVTPSDVVVGVTLGYLVALVSDSVTVTDSPSVATDSLVAGISESITLTDVPGVDLILWPDVSESVTIADAAPVVMVTVAVYVSDATMVTEVIGLSVSTLEALLTEGVTVVDAPTVNIPLPTLSIDHSSSNYAAWTLGVRIR